MLKSVAGQAALQCSLQQCARRRLRNNAPSPGVFSPRTAGKNKDLANDRKTPAERLPLWA